ncbi:MAG: hypothetical protein HRF49_03875 [bacterium]|jgi:hypothetical protein
MIARIVVLVLTIAVTANFVACNKQDASPSVTTISGHAVRIPSGWNFKDKQEIPLNRPPGISGPYDKIYPCSASLQTNHFAELSVEERMLVNGYELLDNGKSFKPMKVRKPVCNLAGWIAHFYYSKGRMPQSTEELFEHLDELDGKETDFIDLYESIISPVTGKPLEWNHAEFSPGNAFITVINADPAALEIAQDDYSKMIAEQGSSPPEGVKLAFDINAPRDRIFVYSRIYGTSGVVDYSIDTFEWPKK